MPELAAGAVAGVLRLPEELDELPGEVLPDAPEPADLEPDEPGDCVLRAAFWEEEATEAPAAPGRL